MYAVDLWRAAAHLVDASDSADKYIYRRLTLVPFSRSWGNIRENLGFSTAINGRFHVRVGRL